MDRAPRPQSRSQARRLWTRWRPCVAIRPGSSGAASSSPEAAQLLADEALRSGAQTVTVRRHGDWFSIEADRDWLREDLAAFFTPQSYAEGGRNSTRVEVASRRSALQSSPQQATAYMRSAHRRTATFVYKISSSHRLSQVASLPSCHPRRNGPHRSRNDRPDNGLHNPPCGWCKVRASVRSCRL